ncbi:hypothetical protein ACFL4K_00230 [Candidatus Neomarinimicrobiota bacterium]
MALLVAKLQSDLHVITGALSELQPHALILYGGYGRDEGSWIETEAGDVAPYNDYDILAIVKRPVAVEELKKLGKELAAQIGIRWVDVGQKTTAQLARLKPSIYNYDLKYASKVIWGDADVLNLIPEMDPALLPLKEAETLFFTRLWTFLGSLEEGGFRQVLSGDASRFFRNQMAKAVLAVVDGWLLMKAAYHPSYRKRVRRFADLYPDKKATLELAEWALHEKLRPQAPKMSPDEVLDLYHLVYRLYFADMLTILGRYYGRVAKGPEQIIRAMCWSPYALIYRLGMLLIRRTRAHERGLRLRAVQLYLAMAYREGEIDDRRLRKGICLLRRLDPAVSPDLTWHQARLRVAELRVS